MTDERFDELMREAADTYNRPPDELPLDEMWRSIERATSSASMETDAAQPPPPLHLSRKRSLLMQPWLRAAAVLALGVALGRGSVSFWSPLEAPLAAAPALTGGGTNAEFVSARSGLTDQYLGQTVALLIALPTELSTNRPDSAFARRVDDLLLQTRLLIDSPGASDPVLHTLLEDLEVVLAQITRLQADRDPMKIDLFNEGLEQRDLMPRLRDALIYNHMSD